MLKICKRRMSHFASFSAAAEAIILISSVIGFTNSQDLMDAEQTLDCHRRAYKYKVTQTDSAGRMCWDEIIVMSCWGRCDSNEISDWKFPYKRSYHPVCIHGEREVRTTVLSKCEEGVEPGTEVHEYLEAIFCQCSLCRSSEANCEGVSYRGQRNALGFQRG